MARVQLNASFLSLRPQGLQSQFVQRYWIRVTSPVLVVLVHMMHNWLELNHSKNSKISGYVFNVPGLEASDG